MKTFVRLAIAALLFSSVSGALAPPEAEARRAFNRFRAAVSSVVKKVAPVLRRAIPPVVQRAFAPIIRRVEAVARRTVAVVQRAATVATRAVAATANKVGAAVVDTAKKVGTAVVDTAKKVGTAVVAAANTVASAVGGVLSVGFDMAKKIFCQTIGMPFCTLVDLVKGAKTFVERAAKHGLKAAFEMTLADLKDAVTGKLDRLKEKAQAVFTNFRSILTGDQFNLGVITSFAKSNFVALSSLSKELFGPLLGFPFADITSAAIGAVGTAALTPALSAIAAVRYGMKKLMSFLIPKLILGAGSAFNFVNDHLPPGFKEIVGKLTELAGGAGGKGLLAGVFMLSSPETKAKLQRIAASVASVAGAINQGLGGALKLARGDSFKDAEKALGAEAAKDAAKAPAPATPMTPAQLGAMIDGLAELAEDGLIKAANEPVRKLVGKAMQAMTRLLDVPRNAFVAAVGSVPIVGGVVSAALNFGLGIVIDMVAEYITDEVMVLTRDIIKDAVQDVKKTLKDVLKTPKSLKAAQGAAGLMQFVANAAGEVAKFATSAAKGEGGLLADVVVSALNSHLLKGIANPDLRRVVSSGLEALAVDLGKRESLKGFTLSQGAAVVLKGIAKPLGTLVARPIANPRLKSVVAKATESLITTVAGSNVQRVMANPSGFLNGLGVALIKKLKPDLVSFLADKIKNPTMRRVVTTAVNELEQIVVEQGFSALMPFGKLLDKVGASLARGLFDEFTALLGTNVTKAKQTLTMLADKVTSVVPSAKALTEPVLASLNEGSKTLVAQARGCRASITGINTAMAEELFGCLKEALKSAGSAVVRALYDEFQRLLDTNCKSAQGKLETITSMLVQKYPRVKPKADEVKSALRARCAKGVR